MDQEIYKKEYSIGQILSESWKRFTQNFQIILLVVLVVYIPINMILFFVPFDALLEQMGELQWFKAYIRIVQILEWLIGIIATMAIAYIVKQWIDGENVSFKEAIKKSLSRWFFAVWTNILLGIFLFLLTLLLVIPGVIYYVYWIFVIQVVVLHNKSWNDALDYSKNIVKGRWWKVLGYSLVFGTLMIIASLSIGLLEGIILGFLPENFVISIFEVLLDSFTDFLLSYFTVVSVIFFINFDSTKKSEVLD